MICIDPPCYQALTAGAEVIEGDAYGDKVLRLSDGSYLKLFRRKRLISSALWSPYAQRFARACQRLAEHGVPCPVVIALYRIPAMARDAVHYRPLPGLTLRQLLQNGMDEAEAAALRRQLGAFVAHLHGLGVYFRSLHLGNIVLTPERTLGLIDLAEARVQGRRLGRFRRQRNLGHLLRYPEEAAWLERTPDFLEAYRAAP